MWSLYARFAWTAPDENQASVFRQIIELALAKRNGILRVLDAGCGTGEYAYALAAEGCDVVGTDNAHGMLAKARKRCPPEVAERIVFLNVDLGQPLPFTDAAFDCVLAVSSLQAMSNVDYSLSELRRVLRDDGRLIVLHAPRPSWHSLPLRQLIANRLRSTRSLPFGRRTFLLAKQFLEWRGWTIYWNLDELTALLVANRFQSLVQMREDPIILVANAG